MTDTELQLANEIKREIKALESFLFSAEKVWTGKVVKRTSKFIIKSNPYGVFTEAEYLMNTEIKNKVLDVLRNELSDIKKRLAEI